MKIMLLTLTAFSHLLDPDLQFLSLLTLELLTSLKGNPGGKAGAGHRESKVETPPPQSPEWGKVGKVMITLYVMTVL